MLHIASDPVAMDAYTEARLRRSIGNNVATAMSKKGLSQRQLARLMGTGKSQVQRVLNKTRGGSLTLLTLVKAARALDSDVYDLLKAESSTKPGATS
jgi:transcriptional regulator with XRE-family HTH domain